MQAMTPYARLAPISRARTLLLMAFTLELDMPHGQSYQSKGNQEKQTGTGNEGVDREVIKKIEMAG
jgi:hypothetical protein